MRIMVKANIFISYYCILLIFVNKIFFVMKLRIYYAKDLA